MEGDILNVPTHGSLAGLPSCPMFALLAQLSFRLLLFVVTGFISFPFYCFTWSSHPLCAKREHVPCCAFSSCCCYFHHGPYRRGSVLWQCFLFLFLPILDFLNGIFVLTFFFFLSLLGDKIVQNGKTWVLNFTLLNWSLCFCWSVRCYSGITSYLICCLPLSSFYCTFVSLSRIPHLHFLFFAFSSLSYRLAPRLDIVYMVPFIFLLFQTTLVLPIFPPA